MYVNKWFCFTAAAFLQVSAGVGYCFSIYAGELKEVFGYTQTQVQGIATPLLASLIAGWLPGLAYDALESRHGAGPRITLLVGVVLHLSGYLALYCAAMGWFHAPYWLIVSFAVTAFNGFNWVDTACMATNVRNFPHNRGTVVGILKSFVGLSASVYTTLYVAAFRPHALTFLIFIGTAPVLVGLAAIPFINHVPFRERSELVVSGSGCTTGQRFGAAYQVVLTMGLAQLAAAVFGTHRLDQSVRIVMLVGSGILLLPLLAIPWGSGGVRAVPVGRTSEDEEHAPVKGDVRRTTKAVLPTPAIAGVPPASAAIPAGSHQADTSAAHEPAAALHSPATGASNSSKAACSKSEIHACLAVRPAAASSREAGLHEPLLSGEETSIPQQNLDDSQAAAPAWPVDLTPWQCQRSLNYWLLFLIFGIDTSMGILFLNNLGQIVQSKGGSADGQDLLVSLFSVLNASGRLAFGYVPERMLHSWRVPRSVFLVLVAAATALMAAWTAVAPVGLLSVIAIVWGFVYGGHWSLMPVLASEVFGLTHFATNYCLLQTSTSIGSYALGAQLAGRLYQASVARHGDSDNVCLGQDCFRSTFLISACLGLLSTLLATILLHRTRGLYRREFIELVTEDEEIQVLSREQSLIHSGAESVDEQSLIGARPVSTCT